MRRLRVGVVGVGARAGLAAWAHGDESNSTVVAVADPDPSAGKRAVELFGPEVQTVRSHRDLVSIQPALDAAFVTSPDDTHAEVTIDLLRAGIPVYLEKPLATSASDADEVLKVARDTGTKLYVGHNMRHMAVVKLMRDIINRGEIGEVKAIWCRHFVGHGGDFYFKDWHADREHTNGLLLQKGAHDIDVIHWLANGFATEVVGMGDLQVYGQLARGAAPAVARESGELLAWPPLSQTALHHVVNVEDTSMLAFRLNNGVLCSYSQCHFTPDYWRNYTVIGTEGRLENFGDGGGGVVRVWNRRHGYVATGDKEYPIVGNVEGHADADAVAVAEFLSFVRDGTPTQTSPVAARNAVMTGIEGTASLRSGSEPRRVPALDPELVSYFENGQMGTEVLAR